MNFLDRYYSYCFIHFSSSKCWTGCRVVAGRLGSDWCWFRRLCVYCIRIWLWIKGWPRVWVKSSPSRSRRWVPMLVQRLDASAVAQENSFSDMYHPSGRYLFIRVSLGNQHGPVYQTNSGRIPGLKDSFSPLEREWLAFIHMDEELFVHLTTVGALWYSRVFLWVIRRAYWFRRLHSPKGRSKLWPIQ